LKLTDIADSIYRLVADATPLKATVAVFGALFSYVLPTNTMRESAMIAVVLIGIDTITGILASIMTGKPLQSKKAVRIIGKVVAYTAAAAAVSLAFKTLTPLSTMREEAITGIIWAVIATETLSVLENAEAMGLPLPGRVVALLKGHLRDYRSAKPKDKLGA